MRLVDWDLNFVGDWLLDDVWNLLDDLVRLMDWVWNFHFVLFDTQEKGKVDGSVLYALR